MANMHINDFDTFKEWKDKTNHLSDGVGDTDHLTTLLATNVVEELLRIRNLSWTTEQIQDIVGGMVTNNPEYGGISVTYDDNSGKLVFSGGGAGSSGSSGSNIIDSAEGVQTLFDFWVANGGNVNGCVTLECFFNDVVVGPSGANGVRGMDADGLSYIVNLGVYQRTAVGVSAPVDIPDTGNGSSYRFDTSDFIVPTGWSKSTPQGDSDDQLWLSQAIVTSPSGFTKSREYQINNLIHHEGKTWKYKGTGNVDLTLLADNDAYNSPYDVDTVISYDSNEGGYWDSINATLIPANSYNFLELNVVIDGTATTLNPNFWEYLHNGIKIDPISDWTPPVSIDLAGDGANGKSLYKVPVYTVSTDATTIPNSPIGGSYNFTGDGTLVPPIDDDGNAPLYVWVEDHTLATLPGGGTTYGEDQDIGALWYTMATFVGDSPTETIYYTVDGTSSGTGKDWGTVARSGRDGVNGRSTQGIILSQRAVDDDVNAGLIIHPIYRASTNLPARFSFTNDQLEFDYYVSGSTWLRWPRNIEEFIGLLVDPSTGEQLPYDANTDPYVSFTNGDRVGGVGPTDDPQILTQSNYATYSESTDYIGYYVGSPKPVIDSIKGWLWVDVPPFTTVFENLYQITSMASTISDEGEDTTLLWSPGDISGAIDYRAKSSQNGQDGLDGIEGQSTTMVTIYNRQEVGEDDLDSSDTPGTGVFKFYDHASTTEINSIVVSSLPTTDNGTSRGWHVIQPNNANDLGCATSNCWLNTDKNWISLGTAVKPKSWVINNGYSVDEYVLFNRKTWKCLVATSFTPANPADYAVDAPGIHASWGEITQDSLSGEFSTSIVWGTPQVTEFGLPGSAGDRGSQFISDLYAPSIHEDPVSSGVWKIYDVTGTVTDTYEVLINDVYLNRNTGEMFSVVDDGNNTSTLILESQWSLDVRGTEYNFWYRKYILGVAESSDAAKGKVQDELDAAATYKTGAGVWPAPTAGNDGQDSENTIVWTTGLPSHSVSEGSNVRIFAANAKIIHDDNHDDYQVPDPVDGLPIQWGDAIQLTGDSTSQNHFFYGTLDPVTGNPFEFGILEIGYYDSNDNWVDPVACDSGNTTSRIDSAGDIYIRVDPNNESWFSLDDNLVWVSQITNLRGADGTTLNTIYYSSDSSNQPSTPSTGPTLPPSGWQLAEPAANDFQIWKSWGTKTSGQNDWIWATPHADAPSRWFSGTGNPNDAGVADDAVSGDFYVRFASGTVSDEVWEYNSGTWYIKISEMSGTDGNDGLSTIILHQNAASQPPAPTTAIFTTTTTWPVNGWYDTNQSGSGDDWIIVGRTTTTVSNQYVFGSVSKTTGTDGTQGPTGAAGTNGARGSKYFLNPTVNQTFSASYCVAVINAAIGGIPVIGDVVEFQITATGNDKRVFTAGSYSVDSNWKEIELYVDGDAIIAGTLSLEAVKSGTTDIGSDISFSLGAGTEFAGYGAAGVFESTATDKWGLIVASENYQGIGVGSQANDANAVVGVGSANKEDFDQFGTSDPGRLPYTRWLTQGELGSNFSTPAGVVSHIYASPMTPYNEAKLSTASYAGDFDGDVTADSFTPFTGSHDALIDPDTAMEGDIVVDVEVIAKVTISDTLTKVGIASSSNQKGVVGVFNNAKNKENEHPKSIFAKTFKNIDTMSVDTIYTIKPEFKDVYDAHDLISINSLGEGQVNVCGENGDLEIGDLIVTSSIAGKGMKQDDDIVRSITVAKVRENVTFSSPDEIKLVACIYMCG